MSADRLKDRDKYLLLVSLGKLYDVVELLSELPTIDGGGRYIEESFVREYTERHGPPEGGP